MNPIFYQYRNQDNNLDKLIKLFEEEDWCFIKADPNYFHTYIWPDIILSEKEGKMTPFENSELNPNNKENFSIELLGCYEFKDNRWENEGSVVLYVPKIKQAAYQYWVDNFSKKGAYNIDDEEYYTKALSTIILIHEFVHWIMHWIESPGFIDEKLKKQFIPFKYSIKDEIYFQESIAQLFTKFICEDSNDLRDIFIWLENHQPSQYNSYKLFSGYNNSKKFIKIFLNEIQFMRQYNLQSYGILDCLLKMQDEINEFENSVVMNIKSNKKNAEFRFEKLLLAKEDEMYTSKIKNQLISIIKNEFQDLSYKYRGIITGEKFGI